MIRGRNPSGARLAHLARAICALLAAWCAPAIAAPNDTGSTTGIGPDVLYVTDPQRAWRLLEAPPRAEHIAGVGLIIAPLRDEHTVDSWERDRARFVAPIQILLDSMGLGGGLAETAQRVAEGW